MTRAQTVSGRRDAIHVETGDRLRVRMPMLAANDGHPDRYLVEYLTGPWRGVMSTVEAQSVTFTDPTP